MLYSISLALAFLFAAMVVFLSFFALYVKYKYVHNMAHIYQHRYSRQAYSRKRVIITKMIKTAICSYLMIELSEFERAQ